MKNVRVISATAAAALVVLALSTANLSAQTSQPAAHHTDTPSALVQELRQALRAYEDVRRAGLDGYAPFLGCVSGPEAGAMGTHYVNSQHVGDAELEVNRPEALIYESKGGVVSLVGVEYLVLAEVWHKAHAEPPVFKGQTLHYTASPNRYGLPAFYEVHVWAWRNNPNGTFADWNTHVSCEG